MMSNETIATGDRVSILLVSDFWGGSGWFEGVVVRVDPYSKHRSFYWVELDAESQAILGRGVRFISVLNPKNIKKLAQSE